MAKQTHMFTHACIDLISIEVWQNALSLFTTKPKISNALHIGFHIAYILQTIIIIINLIFPPTTVSSLSLSESSVLQQCGMRNFQSVCMSFYADVCMLRWEFAKQWRAISLIKFWKPQWKHPLRFRHLSVKQEVAFCLPQTCMLQQSIRDRYFRLVAFTQFLHKSHSHSLSMDVPLKRSSPYAIPHSRIFDFPRLSNYSRLF